MWDGASDRRTSAARRFRRHGEPGELDREACQSGVRLAEAGAREGAALRAEGVRGDELCASGEMGGMDALDDLGRLEQGVRRPEREARREAGALELGARRAVEEERRAVSREALARPPTSSRAS